MTHSRDAPAPTLVLVGGYAGSGKSEFSRYLSEITGWALLDKDSLSAAMAERLLLSLGGDPHDRHTELYLREVRPLEYRCLLETAFANPRAGTSAILSAPFIAELTDPRWTYRLTDQCTAMGVEVTVSGRAATLRPCAGTSNSAEPLAMPGSWPTGTPTPAAWTSTTAHPRHTSPSTTGSVPRSV